MAMASENSALGQPNSLAMGSWNTPKLARIEKPTIRMIQPEIRTGVNKRLTTGRVRAVIRRGFYGLIDVVNSDVLMRL